VRNSKSKKGKHQSAISVKRLATIHESALLTKKKSKRMKKTQILMNQLKNQNKTKKMKIRTVILTKKKKKRPRTRIK
jgi:hypothetical protein